MVLLDDRSITMSPCVENQNTLPADAQKVVQIRDNCFFVQKRQVIRLSRKERRKRSALSLDLSLILDVIVKGRKMYHNAAHSTTRHATCQ